jgi:hypothetical protein
VSILNLGLDLLGKALELVHVRLLGVPDNAQTLALVWLGDLQICTELACHTYTARGVASPSYQVKVDLRRD